MLGPLIALALFCGVVWVVAHAIFLIIHVDQEDDVKLEHRDPIATFIEENYGTHFLRNNRRDESKTRRR